MSTESQPKSDLSAVYARGARAMPQVSQPNSPWTLIVGMGGVGLLGLIAFTSLSNARAQSAVAAPAAVERAAPASPPLGATILAQNTVQPPAPMAAVSAPNPMTPTVSAPNPNEANLHAPAVVVDLSDGATPAAPRLAQAAPGVPAPAEDQRLNAEERFAARVSGSTIDTARATQMRDLTRTIPQGFVIPAVLETAIHSDLPGSVRAVVSRDVRGFDGNQVLVPRGSKLIGQYRSAVAVGQTRAFVVWSRIITPSGVSIDVGSPATDTLGRGGLAGTADTHFLERFGSSILLSIVSAGVEAAGRSSNSTSLVIGSSTQASQVAGIALQKQIDIPTTIRVAQGTAVQVSVARDLDFSGVASVR